MKLYLISQSENNDWDTYDAAVVAAESEDEARSMSPVNGRQMMDRDWDMMRHSWVSSTDKVSVKYIGEAAEGTERGLVLSSFNAG